MMKADYGTYSNTWLIVGPLAGAAVLGGLTLLLVPPWARATLGLLAVLLALAGVYMIYMTCALANDDLKKAIRDILLARLPWDGQGKALDIGTGSGLMAIGLASSFRMPRSWGATLGRLALWDSHNPVASATPSPKA